MFAELRHLDGPRAGQTRVVQKEFSIIGRHPSVDVRFDTDRELDVSGRHAALFRQGTDWMLRDLGSTNGTWVNGVRIEGDRRLQPNDVIRLGERGPQVVFSAGSGDAPTIPLTARQAEPPPPRPGHSRGAYAPELSGGPRVVFPSSSTTQRIRHEVTRQIAPWRRAVLGLGVLALLGGIGAVLVVWQRGRARETERIALLARTDSLIQRLTETTSSILALEDQLERARQETGRLRVSLSGKGLSARRLDSLSHAVAGSLRQHESVLQAARFDAAAIRRDNGDAIAMVVSEFPDGRRVAGTGFAVRARGDTGWIITSRHLVSDGRGNQAARLGLIFNGSNQNFRAEVAATADSADIAVLTVRVRGGVPVVRGLGGGTRDGEPVAILGYPYGFDLPMGSDWRRHGVSVSSFAGSVRTTRADAIEVDAYGASGSSGSPVFNAAGQVTGVIYGGDPATSGRIVYAVPAAAVASILRRAGVL